VGGTKKGRRTDGGGPWNCQVCTRANEGCGDKIRISRKVQPRKGVGKSRKPQERTEVEKGRDSSHREITRTKMGRKRGRRKRG